jgi:glycosyltransferase involved in cell wall biosynthesis
VLHLGKFFAPQCGGMESYLADLVGAQHAQGTPAFALVHGQPLAHDPFWLMRVPVQAQWMYAPIALGYRAALAGAIKAFKPDVLHLHLPNSSVFWALTLASARELPWVVHWHSDVLFAQPSWALRCAHRLYHPLEQAVLARARRVVATSPSYLDASASLKPWRGKCDVVPLGLQGRPQTPADPLSTPHAWTPGRLRVLSLGRLAHYKGFETLIQAVAGLQDIELVIAGDGEQRAELELRIQQLQTSASSSSGTELVPTIHLLGAIGEAEKHALLASCDVFALASRERTEAFGLVLLEAMMHAKPCLVSNLPGSGMPWVVESSQAGLLVPLNDIQAWRSALQTMATQPQQRLAWGEAARLAFNNRFTADVSSRGLQPVYRSALGLRPLPRATGGLLIVIPARNEARTIGSLLRRLREAGYNDVVVIDDLSHDGTGDMARREGAKVLRPVLGMGAWGGMQTGIRYALQQGFDTVITMDADGQHEVDELPTLLAASRCNNEVIDVVIGAHPQRASRLRHIAWAWFRGLTGLNVTDLTSGFRCYNTRALPILASGEATLLDYQDLGTLLLLRHAGLTVIEVPVSMNPRVDGISRIFDSWLSVTRYMAVTTLLCFSRWRRGGKVRRD